MKKITNLIIKKTIFSTCAFLCMFMMAAPIFSNEAVLYSEDNNGFEIGLIAGWKRLIKSMNTYEKMDDDSKEVGKSKGNLFGFSLYGKYQAPGQIYGKLKGEYYASRKLSNRKYNDYFDNHTSKFYQRNLGAAIGYTFGLLEETLLLSPFVDLSYIHNNYFFNGEKLSVNIDKRMVHSGWFGAIGLDIKKIWKNNFTSNLLVKLGMPLRANEKFREKITNASDYSMKQKLKRKMFYEVALQPINYQIGSVNVGIELNHGRHEYRSKLHKVVDKTFGAAVNVGWVF